MPKDGDGAVHGGTGLVRWHRQWHRRWRRAVAVLAAVCVAVIVGPLLVAGPAAAETVRDGQWFLRTLKIEQANRLSTGAGVTVAVVDTGIEADHPDLSGQVIGGTAIGVDGGPLIDTDSHGTSLAGLIAAKGGGPNHALGVAPGAKLLSVRVGGTFLGFDYGNVVAGIRWAADHGAKVINLSFGSETDPLPDEVAAVNYALSRDAVVVAAAGNRNAETTHVTTPANIPGVIAVGATGKNGAVYSTSVSGAALGVVAPGEKMVTTGSRRAGKSSGYVIPTGTSEATAVVSGVVALIRSKYPDLHAADVINRLVRTADDLGPAGRDPDSGFGLVDPVRALTAAVPATGVNPLGAPTVASPTNEAGPTGYNIRPRSWWRARIQLILAASALVIVALLAVPVLILIRSSRRRRLSAAAYRQARSRYAHQSGVPHARAPQDPPPARPRAPSDP